MEAAEQFLSALRRAPPKGGGSPSAIPAMVQAWKGVGDVMLKSLMDSFSDIESRGENLRVASELLETRLRDLEEKEREFNVLCEVKSEELRLRETRLRDLEEKEREFNVLYKGKSEELKLREARLRDLEDKEKGFNALCKGRSEELKLRETRLRDLEEKERGFNAMFKGKSEELKLRETRLKDLEEKEREFNVLCKRNSEEFRLREEILDEQLKLVHEHINKLEASQGEAEVLRAKVIEKMKEIEKRESELDGVNNWLLEKRLSEVGKREMELEALYDGKFKDLRLKEEVLAKEKQNVKLTNEKLESELDAAHNWLLEERLVEVGKREKEKEELEALYDGKFKDLRLKEEVLAKEKQNVKLTNEKLESELDAAHNWLLEERLVEVGKREKEKEELEALYDGKFKDLRLKEEVLAKEKEKFAEEVKLTNEKLRVKQKLGCGLIERLDMAFDLLGGMKVLMDEKFKEIESRETTAHESLTSRLSEADLIRESLEKRFKELEDIEKELTFSQEDTSVRTDKDKANSREEGTEKQKLGLQMFENNKPEERKHEELGRQDLKEGECREKSLISARESPQNNVKENIALSKLDQPQRHLVGTDARPVAYKGQQVNRLRDVDLKQSVSSVTTGARLTIKQEKSVDLSDALQKDQKALELLINDPEKDLDLMGDKVYKILSLSCDPAKLVLDTVNALRLGKLGTECRVNRATVLLLDQLTKMSLKIQPCVTKAATKLALEWKSKMSTTGENPMEALGFLRFLAAYNLSSHFNKNELFSFLKLSAQHKQMPDLCHALGLTVKIPGFINTLISEKRFLLASTYVHTYQLQHQFPQAGLLNYYVTHSKWSANAKRRRECNSFEARNSATASEIADLRIAIEHITNYGLESVYSTNALTAKIKQLEVNLANFNSGGPIPTTAGGGSEGFGRGKKAAKKARRRASQASKDSGAALNQMPCYGSNSWASPVPDWRETQPVNAPLGFPYQWGGCVNLVPMQQPMMAPNPYNDHTQNVWYNSSGQQFCS